MPPRPRHISLEQLFWQTLHAPNDPNICWPWPNMEQVFRVHPHRAYGYFKFRFPGGAIEYKTHRIAWILTYRFIIPGLLVCHHCDYPPCCNPTHLFLGTNQANVQDREAKGRLPYGNRAGDLRGRWSRNVTACLDCHTTTAPHYAHGICQACYDKKRNHQRTLLRRQNPKRFLRRNGRWAQDYVACISCHATDQRHMGHGLCVRCYGRQAYHRDKP